MLGQTCFAQSVGQALPVPRGLKRPAAEDGRLGAVRLAALAHLGRENEMIRSRDNLLKSIPHLTVSLALRLSPELGEPYAEGLRKAGLPE